MAIKRLTNGELFTVYGKLVLSFAAGALAAVLLWRLLGL